MVEVEVVLLGVLICKERSGGGDEVDAMKGGLGCLGWNLVRNP